MRDYLKDLKSKSTKKIAMQLLLLQGFSLIAIIIVQFLQMKLEFQTIVAILAGGVFSSLLFVSMFCLGLLYWIRKENPFTMSGQWFGSKLFSKGVMAQVEGLLLMLISLIGLVSVLILLARKLGSG